MSSKIITVVKTYCISQVTVPRIRREAGKQGGKRPGSAAGTEEMIEPGRRIVYNNGDGTRNDGGNVK